MGILNVEADDALILSLSRSQDSEKKGANTINLLSWKRLLSSLPIVQLTVVSFQIICCRLAEETTTKKPFSEKPISQFCFASPGYSSYIVKLHGKEGSQNNDLR